MKSKTNNKSINYKMILIKQLLFLPLLLLIPFLFFFIIPLLLNVNEMNRFLFVLIPCILLSAVISFLFTIGNKNIKSSHPYFHYICIFTPSVLIAAGFLISCLLQTNSKMEMIILGLPFFIQILLIGNINTLFIFPFMFSILLTYELVHFFRLRKIYITVPICNSSQFKNKITKYAFPVSIAIIFLMAIILSSISVIPEIEYQQMLKTFKEIPFNEEIDDYNFYEKTPFSNNNLAILSKEPTLVFDDIDKSPRLDGATAFYPLYSSYVENLYTGFKNYYYENKFLSSDFLIYPSSNPYGNILNCTTTSSAYNRLLEKEIDMIFAFEPSNIQIEMFESAGEELILTKIGYDAFTFFVSQNNPINSLTLEQIQKIYTGELRNWHKVGGMNKRIFAFQRPKNSGSQTIMENAVMKGLKIDTQIEANTVRTMGGMIKVIGGYLNADNAIGYTFMYYSSSMVTSNDIKYISVNGVLPTPENVKDGTYLFSIPFYAITLKSNNDESVANLLSWIQQEQGQELLIKTGYVGL